MPWPRPAAARLLRSWVRIPQRAWIFVCCECRVLSGRGFCDELITRPEEPYRLCCVVVCDLETLRVGAPYIYDISRLRVNRSKVFLCISQIIKNSCYRNSVQFPGKCPLIWSELSPHPMASKVNYIQNNMSHKMTLYSATLPPWQVREHAGVAVPLQTCIRELTG